MKKLILSIIFATFFSFSPLAFADVFPIDSTTSNSVTPSSGFLSACEFDSVSMVSVFDGYNKQWFWYPWESPFVVTYLTDGDYFLDCGGSYQTENFVIADGSIAPITPPSSNPDDDITDPFIFSIATIKNVLVYLFAGFFSSLIFPVLLVAIFYKLIKKFVW